MKYLFPYCEIYCYLYIVQLLCTDFIRYFIYGHLCIDIFYKLDIFLFVMIIKILKINWNNDLLLCYFITKFILSKAILEY